MILCVCSGQNYEMPDGITEGWNEPEIDAMKPHCADLSADCFTSYMSGDVYDAVNGHLFGRR
jgi:hypothetical protein